MTIRVLLLPAMLVALFAVSRSTVQSELRNELPKAPAPRVKKTTSEILLMGT
jgi:hypothetical protein